MRAFPRTTTPTTFFPSFPPEEQEQLSSRLLLWLDRQRQRAHPVQLENWQLDDIGISRFEAVMESRRWD
jgi:uncharacterized protein YjiS (DUF1127 family)